MDPEQTVMNSPSGKTNSNASIRSWHKAAQELVNASAELQSADERIALMQQLCNRLGSQLYPAFLQILCTIEKNATPTAKAIVVETLIRALSSARTPGVRIPQWGAPNVRHSDTFDHSRTLGPIEYLCTWFAQPSKLDPIGDKEFGQAATSIVRLISTHTEARRLYCSALVEQSRDWLGATFAWQTREAMLAFANAWTQSEDPEAPIAACMASVRRSSADQLGQLDANPFV